MIIQIAGDTVDHEGGLENSLAAEHAQVVGS